MDYEHRELESKIDNLKREIDDLRYEIVRLKDDKADKNHSHKQYQVAEMK